MSGMDRLTVLADQLDANAANAERMMELLQPEFDAFEARTGHNVYVVRDYVDHRNAAKRQRQEAADIRELLAHRRASQAAPAPSDRLREAVEALRFESNELTGPGNALRGGWMLAIKAVLDLLENRAVASASLAQEGAGDAKIAALRAALSTPTEERQ